MAPEDNNGSKPSEQNKYLERINKLRKNLPGLDEYQNLFWSPQDLVPWKEKKDNIVEYLKKKAEEYRKWFDDSSNDDSSSDDSSSDDSSSDDSSNDDGSNDDGSNDDSTSDDSSNDDSPLLRKYCYCLAYHWLIKEKKEPPIDVETMVGTFEKNDGKTKKTSNPLKGLTLADWAYDQYNGRNQTEAMEYLAKNFEDVFMPIKYKFLRIHTELKNEPHFLTSKEFGNLIKSAHKKKVDESTQENNSESTYENNDESTYENNDESTYKDNDGLMGEGWWLELYSFLIPQCYRSYLGESEISAYFGICSIRLLEEIYFKQKRSIFQLQEDQESFTKWWTGFREPVSTGAECAEFKKGLIENWNNFFPEEEVFELKFLLEHLSLNDEKELEKFLSKPSPNEKGYLKKFLKRILAIKIKKGKSFDEFLNNLSLEKVKELKDFLKKISREQERIADIERVILHDKKIAFHFWKQRIAYYAKKTNELIGECLAGILKHERERVIKISKTLERYAKLKKFWYSLSIGERETFKQFDELCCKLSQNEQNEFKEYLRRSGHLSNKREEFKELWKYLDSDSNNRLEHFWNLLLKKEQDAFDRCRYIDIINPKNTEAIEEFLTKLTSNKVNELENFSHLFLQNENSVLKKYFKLTREERDDFEKFWKSLEPNQINKILYWKSVMDENSGNYTEFPPLIDHLEEIEDKVKSTKNRVGRIYNLIRLEHEEKTKGKKEIEANENKDNNDKKNEIPVKLRAFKTTKQSKEIIKQLENAEKAIKQISTRKEKDTGSGSDKDRRNFFYVVFPIRPDDFREAYKRYEEGLDVKKLAEIHKRSLGDFLREYYFKNDDPSTVFEYVRLFYQTLLELEQDEFVKLLENELKELWLQCPQTQKAILHLWGVNIQERYDSYYNGKEPYFDWVFGIGKDGWADDPSSELIKTKLKRILYRFKDEFRIEESNFDKKETVECAKLFSKTLYELEQGEFKKRLEKFWNELNSNQKSALFYWKGSVKNRLDAIKTKKPKNENENMIFKEVEELMSSNDRNKLLDQLFMIDGRYIDKARELLNDPQLCKIEKEPTSFIQEIQDLLLRFLHDFKDDFKIDFKIEKPDEIVNFANLFCDELEKLKSKDTDEPNNVGYNEDLLREIRRHLSSSVRPF